MSGTKKGEEDNSHSETEPPIKEPKVEKKYPFQTTRKNNSEKVVKQEESKENLVDKQNEAKIDNDISKDSQIEVLTHVVNDPDKPDQNLPQMVNEAVDRDSENPSLQRVDTTDSTDHNVQFHQAAEILTENKTELDLVEVAEKKGEKGKRKNRLKDLTEAEIKEICGDKYGKGRTTYTKTKTPGLDPRFQQQNQTMRCFVMYTDFYRCENILGKGEVACQWFKDVFTSICPLDWIRRWDEAREEGRLGWTKGRTQGKFPGDRYGV